MFCKETSFNARVCLIAQNTPLSNNNDPRILPIVAVKTSTGKVIEKGLKHYIESEWKDAWSNWLRNARDSFPSVLEHITFTFFINGCSRVCSHQLVRHRLVSFTQESQRYTESRILKAISKRFDQEFKSVSDALPFTALLVTNIRGCLESSANKNECNKTLDALNELFVFPPNIDKFALAKSYAKAVFTYLSLRNNGVRMEDARFILPQAIRTSILMTTNLREYLHIIELRDHPKAQWEIREIAQKMREILSEVVPEVFKD